MFDSIKGVRLGMRVVDSATRITQQVINSVVADRGTEVKVGDTMATLQEAFCAVMMIRTLHIRPNQSVQDAAWVNSMRELSDWLAKVTGMNIEADEFLHEWYPQFMDRYHQLAKDLSGANPDLVGASAIDWLPVIADYAASAIYSRVLQRHGFELGGALDSDIREFTLDQLEQLCH